MKVGVLAGIIAGAIWGFAFVGPAMVAPFTSLELALARYLVFGFLSIVVLVWLRFNPFTRLKKADWIRIIWFGLAGNTLYFSLMATGITLAGTTPVALVIGSVPVVMSVVGNIRRPLIPWAKLLFPLLCILAGLVVISITTVGNGGIEMDFNLLAGLGLVLAFLSLCVWLVYGIANAEYLTDHPTGSMLWASLVGLGTLITMPLLLVAIVAFGGFTLTASGAEISNFVIWAVILGVGCSWLATLFWNKASGLLPSGLLGMLIVTEVIFGVFYDCVINMRLPSLGEVLSLFFIAAGVIWAVLNTQRMGRKVAAITGPIPVDT